MDNYELSKDKAFEAVATHYRNDFSLFWQRTNFFLLISAGLLGFVISSTSQADLTSNALKLVTASGGLAISIIWALVTLSSLRWIETWRKELVKIDDEINPYKSFSSGENLCSPKQMKDRFRPEVLSGMMPLCFGIAWAYILVDLTI